MKTVKTKFTEETTLLIQGIEGKINEQGQIFDDETKAALLKFIEAYKAILTSE